MDRWLLPFRVVLWVEVILMLNCTYFLYTPVYTLWMGSRGFLLLFFFTSYLAQLFDLTWIGLTSILKLVY